VAGSPDLAVLRRLRPVSTRSVDSGPNPAELHAGRVAPGQGRDGSRVHLSPINEHGAQLYPGGPGVLRDRVVQASLKLVLEPILEADFDPCSYGFRPGRRAQDAIEEIRYLAARGYEQIFEGDIAACFDTIDHAALMGRLRRRVGDKRVLALVKAFLKAGLLDELRAYQDTTTGTPQGGIMTPPTQQITRGWVGCRGRDVVRMAMRSGPTRISLTSRRSTRWRSSTAAACALSCSRVRKLSRFSASLR
jgi:hypothetical protein